MIKSGKLAQNIAEHNWILLIQLKKLLNQEFEMVNDIKNWNSLKHFRFYIKNQFCLHFKSEASEVTKSPFVLHIPDQIYINILLQKQFLQVAVYEQQLIHSQPAKLVQKPLNLLTKKWLKRAYFKYKIHIYGNETIASAPITNANYMILNNFVLSN